MVGASGAMFGLLLAFGMLFPNRMIMLLLPPIPMKAALRRHLRRARTGAGRHGASGIAHFAHLGGMLGGFLMIRYWRGQLPFGCGDADAQRLADGGDCARGERAYMAHLSAGGA